MAFYNNKLFQTGAGIAAPFVAGLFGRSKGPNPAQAQQTQGMAELARANPALDQAYQYQQGILKGGPQLQQSLAPAVQGINTQFDAAQAQALAGAPNRGGALDKAMRQIALGRRMSLANLYGQAQVGAASQLTTLAGADANRAASTLANANAGLMARQQQRSQSLSDMGSVFTRILSGLSFPPSAPKKQQTTPPAIPGASSANVGYNDPDLLKSNPGFYQN